MVVLIIISLILILIIISRNIISNKISKYILTFYLIYCGVWFGISSLNPYGLYEVSDLVYFIQFLGILMFVIGFLYCGRIQTQNNLMIKNEVRFNLDSYKSIPFVLFILILILVYYLMRYYSIVAVAENAGDARMERFIKGELFRSSIEIYFYNYIICSIAIFCYVIILNSIIIEKRFNITFYLSIIYIFIYSLLGSGRGPLIDLFIMLILAKKINAIIGAKTNNSINYNNQNYNAENKSFNFARVFLILVLVIFCLSYMTALRMNLTEINYGNLQLGFLEFLKQSVVYFIGPFRSFNFALNHNYLGTSGLLLGRGTFGGIDELFGRLVSLFGINYNYSSAIIGDLLQKKFITIGSETTFNFAYTHLMIFYFDFGIFGVILLSFLFGYFVRRIINYFHIHPNFFSLAIILLIFDVLVLSIFKWTLQAPDSLIFLIIAYHFSKKNNTNLKIFKPLLIKS